MESYAKQTGLSPDFRVSYSFFSEEEGGRKVPPYQHTRWDFCYDNKLVNTGGHSIIWPEFIGPAGDVLPLGPVPLQGLADMFIIFPQRRAFHCQHIRCGVKGYFMEGKRIAVCEVVEVLGLHRNPTA
jgi:hypothetical protein